MSTRKSTAGQSAAKPQFATLTAGLLARKGEATPAGAHFSVEGAMPSAVRDLPPPEAPAREPKRADTGKRLNGIRPATATASNGKKSAMTIPKCTPACSPMTVAKRQRNVTARAAMTLRLDATHHFCLKLVAAKTRRTSQDILVSALEHYLRVMSKDELADCNCLKELLEESQK